MKSGGNTENKKDKLEESIEKKNNRIDQNIKDNLILKEAIKNYNKEK